MIKESSSENNLASNYENSQNIDSMYLSQFNLKQDINFNPTIQKVNYTKPEINNSNFKSVLKDKKIAGLTLGVFLIALLSSAAQPVAEASAVMDQKILQDYEMAKTGMVVNIVTNKSVLDKKIFNSNKDLKIVSEDDEKVTPFINEELSVRINVNLTASIKPLIVNGKKTGVSNIYITDKTAYISYCTVGEAYGGGVQVVDLTDSQKPVLKSELKINDTDVYSVAVKDDKLFLAGATDSGQFKNPAILEVFQIYKHDPTFEIKRINLPSYAGTSVITAKNKIMVASASKGGITQINPDTLIKEAYYPLENVGSLSADKNNELTAYSSMPGSLHIFKNFPEKSGLIFTKGANVENSQISVESNTDNTYLGASDGGLIVLNSKTGQTIFENKPPRGLTYSASGDDKNIFMAEVGDGIGIIKTKKDNYYKLGKIDLNGNYNSYSVKYDDGVLIASTDDGVKIMKVMEKPSIDNMSELLDR